jgi:hypothetical protein
VCTRRAADVCDALLLNSVVRSTERKCRDPPAERAATDLSSSRAARASTDRYSALSTQTQTQPKSMGGTHAALRSNRPASHAHRNLRCLSRLSVALRAAGRDMRLQKRPVSACAALAWHPRQHRTDTSRWVIGKQHNLVSFLETRRPAAALAVHLTAGSELT